jgi:2-aminoadipate transaminase
MIIVMCWYCAKQGIDLVCAALLRPGDIVLAENPTYFLSLSIFRERHITIVGVPTDRNGIILTELEGLIIKHKPKMLYTIPTFNNPRGYTLSEHTVSQLLSFLSQTFTSIANFIAIAVILMPESDVK